MKPALAASAFLVALAASLDLHVALRGDLSRPSAATFEKAKSLLESRKQPGDLVVLSPLFSVTELQGLGELKGRPDLPDEAARARRRVLLLDRLEHPMFGFDAPSEELEIGEGLVLRIFAPAGRTEAPLFDLFESIGPDSMRVERPPGTVVSRCNQPRAEGGFSCPGVDEWLYAAQRTLRIGGVDVTCVWAHPTNGGNIVFELPARPAPAAGSKLRLWLQGGLADDAVDSTPDGAVVRTVIKQGEQAMGQISVPNRRGFVETTVEIEPEKPVTLETSTPKDGRRHYCINARILETAAQ